MITCPSSSWLRASVWQGLLSFLTFVIANGQEQNLLRNGSFEFPVSRTNWLDSIVPEQWEVPSVVYVANGQVNLSPPWAGFPYPLAQDGAQYVHLDGGPQEDLAQTVTVTNQQRYVLRWFNCSVIAPGSTVTAALYSVRFVADPALLEVVRTNLDAFHREWKPRSLAVDLLPGTYSIRFNATAVPNSSGVLIDNVEFVEQPEDLHGAVSVSEVAFSWPGRTNQLYQVQFRNSASGGDWKNLGSPVWGNRTNWVTDAVLGSERRFYRVIRVP